ncbi:MAG: type I-E CRISPR-associated protein Cas5/CasD [Clostridiales Family XIII bacterium]|jgi:CRISPR system Cascade subunit CasD|nr:type I-E CRISPR-associated protein Cas5/CasD [Clostridiales Family XIII bacterium]
MNTLLIRLAAPLQSWGADSKFTRRSSRREPTKSGVVGLCACALGIRRDDDSAIARIAALEFGVRIDQLGTLLRDYHVAHKSEFWETGKTDPFVSERYYLSDAVFLVGLSGEPRLLETIDSALKAPKLPVYLGRRSCPPSGRLSLGLREMSLIDALRSEDWLASDWYKRRHKATLLEIICDAETGAVIQDLPLSFNQECRRYGLRATRRETFDILSANTSHDPFIELGGGA